MGKVYHPVALFGLKSNKSRRLRRKRRVSLLEMLEDRRMLTSDSGTGDPLVFANDRFGGVIGDAEPVALSAGQSLRLFDEIAKDGIAKNGSVESPFRIVDRDMFVVDLVQGQSISADVDAQYSDFLIDGLQVPYHQGNTFLEVFDASGTLLATNDSGVSPNDAPVAGQDAFLTFTAPSSGDYYVAVSSTDAQLAASSFHPPTAYEFSVENFSNLGLHEFFEYSIQLTKGHATQSGITAETESPTGGRERGITVTGGTAVEGGKIRFDVVIDESALSRLNRTDPFVISYATRDWTATISDQDYSSAAGTLVIPPGSYQDHFYVDTHADWNADNEIDEQFLVDFTTSWGEAAVGVGTILDDPSNIPVFEVSDVSVIEGDQAEFVIAVRSPMPVRQDSVVLNYSVSHWTTDSSDLPAQTGTVTFSPTDQTQTVTISTNEDWEYEHDEFFSLEVMAGNGFQTKGIAYLLDNRTSIPNVRFVGNSDDSPSQGNSSRVSARKLRISLDLWRCFRCQSWHGRDTARTGSRNDARCQSGILGAA
ncbi:MAG: pre-peptidase C-terminal domain-containing protein [Pirellulales bacterium]|nr:pre-peptidase C-terminal domain-containing protein [Pirellulales bacterium]